MTLPIVNLHDAAFAVSLAVLLVVLALALVLAPFVFMAQNRVEARRRNIRPDQRVYTRTDWHPPTEGEKLP